MAATSVRLDGMSGSRVELRTPQGALAVRLPLPGLYNVYNAVAAAATALELGVPLATVGEALEGFGGAFGRVETIPVDGREVSILLVKNPAGANEVLRTLTLEDGALDLWLALNDGIADGRDVSWIWDADFEVLAGRVRRATCSGTRAEEMALRLKYAGVGRASSCRPRPRPLARRRRGERRRRARSTRCPPTRRCWSCATCSRGAVWPGGGRHDERAVIWHDVENGGYEADLPLWRELAAQAGRPGPRSRRRHRPGRARPGRRAGTRSPPWIRTPSCRRARARARERGLHVAAVPRRRPQLRLGGRFALVLAPMQVVQIMGGAAAARGCWLGVRRLLGRAGLRRGDRRPVRGRRGPGRCPPLPDVGRERRLGLLEPAARRPPRAGGVAVERLRQTVSPAGAHRGA